MSISKRYALAFHQNGKVIWYNHHGTLQGAQKNADQVNNDPNTLVVIYLVTYFKGNLLQSRRVNGEWK